MSAASTRTHNTNTCTRQPTATERAGARAALRIRRATPCRCCRRWRGASGERRRPLADQRGDAVQAAAAARDKSSSIHGVVPRLLAEVGSANSESFAPSSHALVRAVVRAPRRQVADLRLLVQSDHELALHRAATAVGRPDFSDLLSRPCEEITLIAYSNSLQLYTLGNSLLQL